MYWVHTTCSWFKWTCFNLLVYDKDHKTGRLRYCLALVSQSGLTLCNPMDCSPPSSSVNGILQARILEWAAIPFSILRYNWCRIKFTHLNNFINFDIWMDGTTFKIMIMNLPITYKSFLMIFYYEFPLFPTTLLPRNYYNRGHTMFISWLIFFHVDNQNTFKCYLFLFS